MPFLAVTSLFTNVSIFVALIFLYICYKQWRYRRYLSDLPWIGTNGRILFPKLGARVHNLRHFETGIKKAYTEYSLKEKSFVYPTPEIDLVILPPSHIEWLNNLPEDCISSRGPVIDTLQAELTFAHPRVVHVSLHHQVIHRDLTRQLGTQLDTIIDEAESAVNDLWPQTTSDFANVHVFPVAMKTLARISNRVFVGLPYCREQTYLNKLMSYSRGVSLWSAILRQFPAVLRPLVAKYYLRDLRRDIQAITDIITPEIEKRRSAIADTEKAGESTHNDILQALIMRADEHGGIEREPALIAGRLIALNFAAIHTSTFSLTNLLFDMAASDPADRVIEQLREEAETTLREGNGRWTKAGLAKMYKMDSTLRESQRINSFLGAGMTRLVIKKEGLTTPNGTYLPYMTKFAFPSYGVHSDTDKYPESGKYDPFRWARQRTDGDEGTEEDNPTNYIRKANLAFVSTNTNYHPFGHGKNSCPGRFFAAAELKLLLAHLVMNYDFEPLKERPKNNWFGPVLLPPMAATIRVRRRGSPCN